MENVFQTAEVIEQKIENKDLRSKCLLVNGKDRVILLLAESKEQKQLWIETMKASLHKKT